MPCVARVTNTSTFGLSTQHSLSGATKYQALDKMAIPANLLLLNELSKLIDSESFVCLDFGSSQGCPAHS